MSEYGTGGANIKHSFRKLILISLGCLILAGCINTQWFISTLYNRADNWLFGQIEDYADFDAHQEQQIKELIDRFHHWHRITQLPQYADFLLSVRAYMADEIVTRPKVESWYEQVNDLAKKTNSCHPMLFGTEIMRSLSDEQLSQIREAMDEQYYEILERRAERTEAERLERRFRNTRNWLGRFELDLDDEGEKLLTNTLESLPNLREESLELWMQWDEGLLKLLEKREHESFEADMHQHLALISTAMEDTYPGEYQASRQIWISFFLQILSREQSSGEDDFFRWIGKMAANLNHVATDIPRDQESWDADSYCSG